MSGFSPVALLSDSRWRTADRRWFRARDCSMHGFRSMSVCTAAGLATGERTGSEKFQRFIDFAHTLYRTLPLYLSLSFSTLDL